MTWEIAAQKKIAERQSRLPKQWLVPVSQLLGDNILDILNICKEKGWLDSTELAITQLTVVELARAIADRKYTAVQVVRAYAHRATIAQQLINP